MIVVYSGEVASLDGFVKSKLPDQHSLTIIPATPEDLSMAKPLCHHFAGVGIRARNLSMAYYQNPKRLRSVVLKSEAIFLCGGNTYEFLQYARDTDLFNLLTEFEQQGGMILAESAGSILLSPDISTAAIPQLHADENHLGVEDLSAYNRLPFHVSPHFDPASETVELELQQLQELANASKLSVAVLQDGQGFAYEQEICFSAGEIHWVSPT
ncbi:MAG: peptidase E [Gammaproteobacteria bacterium]|nr:peptidase E [Gammaproteobacteria bacterium]MDH5729524.1 peptidase E [Gammaproteobacteria bacterium]